MSKSWNVGKNSRGDKELNKIQRLAFENKKLKNEISRLRKAITRVQNGWCAGCLEKHAQPDQEVIAETDKSPTKIVKKDRTCFKCPDGELRIFTYPKMGETWYYRKCNSCNHRTIGKKFTPDVQD